MRRISRSQFAFKYMYRIMDVKLVSLWFLVPYIKNLLCELVINYFSRKYLIKTISSLSLCRTLAFMFWEINWTSRLNSKLCNSKFKNNLNALRRSTQFVIPNKMYENVKYRLSCKKCILWNIINYDNYVNIYLSKLSLSVNKIT